MSEFCVNCEATGKERDKIKANMEYFKNAANALLLTADLQKKQCDLWKAKAEKLAEALRIIEAHADSIHVIGGSLGTCEHCLYQCAQDALSEVEAK